MSRNNLSALLLCAALPLAALSGTPELPEVYPTCPNPQPNAPAFTPAFSVGSPFAAPAIVWNGREYGAVWYENSPFTFASYFADGTLRNYAYPATGLTHNTALPQAMVWDGANYAVAFAALQAGDPNHQIFFMRLTRDGAMVAPPLRVSSVGVAAPGPAANPVIVHKGGNYLVMWNDARNGAQDIFMTLLDSAGAIKGGGTLHDLLVSDTGGLPRAGDQSNPAASPLQGFAQTYPYVFTVWQDFVSGTHWEIYGKLIDLTGGGTVLTTGAMISSGTSNATTPVLATRADSHLLAWVDNRDGNNEIYSAVFSDAGNSRLSADTRLTSDIATSDKPRAVFLGGEYMVAWHDARAPFTGTYIQRVAEDGAPVGANQRLSQLGATDLPAIATSGQHFLIGAQNRAGFFMMKFLPLGCVTDATPPACSANYLAYNITGTSGSVSWSPSADAESGAAYYQLYRNNTAYAKTSDTYFNDSGLGLSTTYNYFVQPVNAFQLQNGNCTASIYLKTSASLTLLMNKSDPHAALSWNDAGLNNYNVFRGTDPRVMQQIGQTPALATQDPNVLNDAVSYFYTVDDPGI